MDKSEDQSATPTITESVTDSIVKDTDEGKDHSQDGVNDPTGDDEVLTIEGLATSHAPNGFDPSIHATNEDGSPKYKADGTFALRRGRKRQTATSEMPSGHVPTKPITRKAEVVDTSETTALVIVSSIEGLFCSAIGPEWKMEDAEKGMNQGAWAAYLRANGMKDLSPGWMVVITTAIYATSRLSHPNTQSKLGGIGAKIKGAFSRALGVFRR